MLYKSQIEYLKRRINRMIAEAIDPMTKATPSPEKAVLKAAEPMKFTIKELNLGYGGKSYGRDWAKELQILRPKLKEIFEAEEKIAKTMNEKINRIQTTANRKAEELIDRAALSEKRINAETVLIDFGKELKKIVK